MAVIPGNDDANIIDGTDLDDTINAMGGDDIIHGSGGLDTIDGGTGQDMVDYSSFDTRLTLVLMNDGKSASFIGGVVKDALYNIENVIGTDQDDFIWGNTANNIFHGNDGDDYFVGSLGIDTYYGDNGSDTAEYSHLNFGVLVKQTAPGESAAFVGGYPVDRLYSVENIVGTFHADIIKGGRDDNMFYGLGDNDILIGRGGKDLLDGGMDDDRLTGGRGSDTFSFIGIFGNDTITDFKATGRNHDVIDLQDASVITSFEDLITNHTTQSAEGVLIDAGEYGTIMLKNATVPELMPDAFMI